VRKLRKKSSEKRFVPSEIISKIIFCLPLKSLVRFEHASKQWRWLIEDDGFVNRYYKNQLQTANHPLYFLLLASSSCASSSSRKLHLHNIGEDSHAFMKSVSVPKCHETISASSHGWVRLHGVKNRSIAVRNPTSEEIIPLPDFPAFN